MRANIKKVLRESSNLSLEFVDKYFLRLKGNYHGLPYKFKLVNDELVFSFENPNNLSYNPNVLRGYKLDLIEDFHQVLGGNLRGNGLIQRYLNSIKISVNDIIPTVNTVYLNDKDTNNFENICKTIKKFQIEGLECDTMVTFRNLFSYGEELSMSVDVYFLSMKYQGKKVTREEFIEIFGNIMETDDGYDYRIDFLKPLMYEIKDNYPLLIDFNWMYFTDDTGFKYKDGERVVWW